MMYTPVSFASQKSAGTINPEFLTGVAGALEVNDTSAITEPIWMIRSKISGYTQTSAANRIAASLDYMMAHLDKPIRVSTLSAMTGISESRYFELFKQVTGDSPLNWFIRARMQCACQLLKHSNLRMKEIASQLGYEDPFYFSRLFKAVHGIAPSEYRAQGEQNP